MGSTKTSRHNDLLPIVAACASFVLLSSLSQPANAQNSQADYLNAHNVARNLVGVSNITWDGALAAYAQNYANARIADCNLVNSGGSFGENLGKGALASFTGVAAVNQWVAEKPNYDYAANACTGGNQCLHYTQVVWSNSVKLGCARVQCANSWWFVTCNYDPRGNVAGQRPY